MKFNQNKKKIDPRYFIAETTNRDKLQEQESVKAPALKIDTSKTAPIDIPDKPTTVAALQKPTGDTATASVKAPPVKIDTSKTAPINIPAPKDTALTDAGTKKIDEQEQESVKAPALKIDTSKTAPIKITNKPMTTAAAAAAHEIRHATDQHSDPTAGKSTKTNIDEVLEDDAPLGAPAPEGSTSGTWRMTDKPKRPRGQDKILHTDSEGQWYTEFDDQAAAAMQAGAALPEGWESRIANQDVMDSAKQYAPRGPRWQETSAALKKLKEYNINDPAHLEEIVTLAVTRLLNEKKKK